MVVAGIPRSCQLAVPIGLLGFPVCSFSCKEKLFSVSYCKMNCCCARDVPVMPIGSANWCVGVSGASKISNLKVDALPHSSGDSTHIYRLYYPTIPLSNAGNKKILACN